MDTTDPQHPTPPLDTRSKRLHDEIGYLRARLVQVGYDGDGTYERALQRAYEVEIERRLLRLRGVAGLGAEELA